MQDQDPEETYGIAISKEAFEDSLNAADLLDMVQHELEQMVGDEHTLDDESVRKTFNFGESREEEGEWELQLMVDVYDN